MSSAYKLVFGILGNMTALSFLFSPTKTFWRISRVKKVGDFSCDPYVTAVLNTLLWVVYGSPSVKLQVLVLTINSTGAAFEFLYIVIYCVYAPRDGRMRVAKLFGVGMLGFTLATSLFLGLDRNHEHRKIFFGVLCGLFCTIMYASPLTIMMMVIKTKSVEYMPFLLSLFIFLNGTVWLAYAIIPEMDIFIAVPNGLGMLLGGGQLILYGIYFKSTPRMQHIAPQEKLAAMTVSNQPKDSTFEREGTKEGVRDGFAEESKEGAQGQEQTQRKITGPEDV